MFKLFNSHDCLELVLPFQRNGWAIDEGKFWLRFCDMKLMINNVLKKKKKKKTEEIQSQYIK